MSPRPTPPGPSDDLPPLVVTADAATGPVARATRGKAKAASAPARVSVIVKVNEPGYVPAGMKVRRRIDEYLFTASGPVATVDKLPTDPKVASVAAAERVRKL